MQNKNEKDDFYPFFQKIFLNISFASIFEEVF
jgi:hypothetical protein